MLKKSRERGSAPLESLFAILLLLALVLGAIQVAFALYGRNVMLSSAHEGARAAVELGRSPADAQAVAASTVERSAGGLVDRLRVDVEIVEVAEKEVVRVRVSGTLKAFGPVPMPIPVSTVATSTRAVQVE